MLTRRTALFSLAAAASATALPRAAFGRADEPVFTPAQLRSDLDALHAGLKSGCYDLYAMSPKRVVDAAFAACRAGLDRPLTQLQARVAFQRACAAIRLGHARVDTPFDAWSAYRKAGGKAFPLELRIVMGRAFVAADMSGLGDLEPGDELTALNGRPLPHWLRRTGRNVSAETDYMLWSLLEYDFALHLWTELGPVDGFDLGVRKPDGRRLALRLPARTREEMRAEAARRPPALDLPMQDARMLPGAVAYLRPGPFYNMAAKTEAEGWDNTGFARFVDDAFARFEQAGATRLLIDLRGNPGGDSTFSDLVVRRIATRPFRFVSKFLVKVSPEAVAANAQRLKADAAAAGPVSRQYADLYARSRIGSRVDFEVPLTPPAPTRFPGKPFALIDRQSYSNTVAVAATLQDYGFATVLGEETSDLATTYGAMERFTLPATGIGAGFPKARLIRPNGDLKPRGVVPDRAVPKPIVQTPADEMLQAALQIVRG